MIDERSRSVGATLEGPRECDFAESPFYAGSQPCNGSIKAVELHVVGTKVDCTLRLCTRHRRTLFSHAVEFAAHAPSPEPQE